ncbi:MAG: helix-turn-helix domain-containing protein, partial [Candidatus Limisoma sp.]
RENVQKDPSWKTADDMLYGLMQKANQLLDHEQYERAQAVAAECDAALTVLGGCADLVDGVYDKRRAEIAGLHALACVGLGDLSGATKWYKQLCETDFGSSPQGGDLALSYLIGTHQYEVALQRLKTEKELFAAGRDTLSHYYVNTLLANELKCLTGLGRTKEALAKSMQIKTLTDSLYARENVDHIAEQSVIYKTKDMEMQLVEQNRLMERQRLIFVIFVVVIVVLIAFVFVLRYFGKKIRIKNRKAVEMIEELADTHEARRRIRTEPAETLSEDAVDADKAEFDAVDRVIVERRLYLQQGFSRDEAAQMSQMSPKHLSTLFKQYADGFPNYINNLRLEHSVKLLRSKTNYTIEGISRECGFQSRQTFHRLFVERYGMTPAEFRRGVNTK